MLRRMKSLRRAAARVPRFPADALAALDASIRTVEQSLAAAEESSKLAARRASAGTRAEEPACGRRAVVQRGRELRACLATCSDGGSTSTPVVSHRRAIVM
jgi:hypothetical protein